MKKLNKATLILFASVLLLALTLAATFSWFPRINDYDSTQYSKMNLTASAVIKPESGLTVNTYQTALVDGKLDTVNVTKLSNGASVSVPAKGVVYFRTVVSNQAASYNVSLNGLTLGGSTGNISVCVLSPLKTSVEYSDSMALIDHIEVSQKNGAVVEWYLYNGGEGEASVTLDSLPQISYN